MAFLFWLLWALDLIGATFILFAAKWREGAGANNPFTSVHFWSLAICIIGLGGGLFSRYGLKMPRLALLFAAAPWLAFLIFYLIDSRSKGA